MSDSMIVSTDACGGHYMARGIKQQQNAKEVDTGVLGKVKLEDKKT